MPTYDPAPLEVLRVLEVVLADKFEATLAAHGVTVKILMAYPNKPGTPALKLRGYPCAAKVKLNSLEGRVAGDTDARILIDAAAWSSMNDDQREALMAHELYHLDPVLDDDGRLTTDDAGRPCLKMRPHDVEAGIFRQVFEWYGIASGEWEMRQAVNRVFEQGILPFPVDGTAQGRKAAKA